MTASPFRRLAVIGVLAASSFALAAAAPTFGPPWISIETPPNPFDATSRGAFLVVHTYHHGEVVASGVSGSAEGIVAGARRTIPLVFDTTTRRGSYALRKQWPSEGTWMLVINTGGRAQGVTALVDISSQGDVAGVRVPTRRSSDGWDLPQQVTARDIDAALETRASRAVSTRQ
ncbi:MAG: hypothetical protein JF602_01420 [Gemmatimonadetes bacterium]|nr:hypothetical protein [Gemmatimonadota bacterium]